MDDGGDESHLTAVFPEDLLPVIDIFFNTIGVREMLNYINTTFVPTVVANTNKTQYIRDITQ